MAPHIANIFNLLCDFNFRQMLEWGTEYLWGGAFNKPPTTKIRIQALEANVEDTLRILFNKEDATLFDVDTGMDNSYPRGKSVFPYVELGGGAVGASLILDYLVNLGFVEEHGTNYQLKREIKHLLSE